MTEESCEVLSKGPGGKWKRWLYVCSSQLQGRFWENILSEHLTKALSVVAQTISCHPTTLEWRRAGLQMVSTQHQGFSSLAAALGLPHAKLPLARKGLFLSGIPPGL